MLLRRERRFCDKFLEKRAGIAAREADLFQLFREVVRLCIAELRCFLQPLGPHRRQVDGRAHGTEGLVGADVGGGLFPADVLFPGLEREHKAAFARCVHGFAHNAARQLAE